MIVQRQYHNFKQFRIYDLSDLKMSSQHLIVSAAAAAGGYNPHQCQQHLCKWRPLLVPVQREVETSLPTPRLPLVSALLCLQGHPMALQRLASFFQEQHYQQRGRRKPVVLVGPRSENGRCLVIGFEATQRMRVGGLLRVGGWVGSAAWAGVKIASFVRRG